MATVRLKTGNYAAIIHIVRDDSEFQTLIEVNAKSSEEAKDMVEHYYGNNLIGCSVVKVPGMIAILE